MRQQKICNSFRILGINVFLLFIFTNFSYASIGLPSHLGSNGSVISLGTSFSYINDENNSSVIGNYFDGYYQDSVNGRFYSNTSSRVKIISSTTKCGDNIYGYKLGGYAYSETMGFIDFDYNDTVFVYYCSNDKSLHGYAYSNHVGYQNFEGIYLGDIQTKSNIPAQEPQGNDETFLNTDTSILENQYLNNSSGNQQQFVIPGTQNQNLPTDSLLEFVPEEESLFYIVK